MLMRFISAALLTMVLVTSVVAQGFIPPRGGGSAPANMVTTDTAQTITGQKTLTANTIFDAPYRVTSNAFHVLVGSGLQSANGAIELPNLAGASSFYAVVDSSTANLLTPTGMAFLNGSLILRDPGNVMGVILQPLTQTGNATLLVPDLGGSSATMYTTANPPAGPSNMATTDTTQDISGNKTFTVQQFFEPNTLQLKSNNSPTRKILLSTSFQTVGDTGLDIPDMQGQAGDITVDQHQTSTPGSGSGVATWTMAQGDYAKRVVIVLYNFDNNAPVTFTFPVAFSYMGEVTANTTGLTPTTLDSTHFVLPITGGVKNGVITIDGI